MAENKKPTDLIAEAERAVATIPDPELKRIAFQKILEHLPASNLGRALESVSKMIQVLAVVVGVVISILSFNEARQKENEARQKEAESREEEYKAKKLELEKYKNQREDEIAKRKTEAARSFVELRQRLYLEAVQAAGVLANPKDHSDEEMKKATKRFRELYVAELSLVESFDVEKKMIGLASALDPGFTNLTDSQLAALRLAHALRDSLAKSWGMDQAVLDNPNR